MKKTLLLAVVLSSGFYAQAQLRLGVKAGVGQSYFSKFENPSGNGTTTSIDNYLQGRSTSYYGGITADWQLTKHFSVQPSLLYSSKAGSTGIKAIWHTIETQEYTETKGDARLNYLELPLNIVFKQKLGPGKILAGAGIYEAMYLNGHKEGTFAVREKPTYKPGIGFLAPRGPLYPNAQADAKLWDTGANFTAGYELPMGLQVALNYNFGFNETRYGKNRVYSLSVSYLLYK
ncbi:outer membrane beta-barrel protein [Chitinophaga sp. Cy-1792]|uniref:outer membrane beta-barrel protein n=1 Tax=Chitinophaga sp. Cy-1792 TaxID=2608339 RepID=UPI001420B65F|nr:outer membrane beta-barrel protein [Chitinophaga sp. Cy-1792]NIG56472.1 PorT family protein [Chitinophaga sp. Cy-1792]